MKLTRKDIYLAKEPLQKLFEIKFPIKTSIALAEFSNQIDPEWGVTENVRIGILKKYGKETQLGQLSIQPGDENWEKFVEEYTELMEAEIEIKAEVIRLPAEADGKPIEIEPSILVNLMKFITVD